MGGGGGGGGGGDKNYMLVCVVVDYRFVIRFLLSVVKIASGYWHLAWTWRLV